VYVNNPHSLELRDNIQPEVTNISIQQLHHYSENISEYISPTKFVSTSKLYAISLSTKTDFACDEALTTVVKLETANSRYAWYEVVTAN
jgi:hypothetical protein